MKGMVRSICSPKSWGDLLCDYYYTRVVAECNLVSGLFVDEIYGLVRKRVGLVSCGFPYLLEREAVRHKWRR